MTLNSRHKKFFTVKSIKYTVKSLYKKVVTKTSIIAPVKINGLDQADTYFFLLQHKIFRGARRYHWGDNGGLRRPYGDSKLKYAAYDRNGNNQGVNHLGFAPWAEIAIWRYNSAGVQWDSDEIFSTTVHETAHSSQVYIMGNIKMWIDLDKRLLESWAVAVEWMMTQREYRERGIAEYSSPTYDEIGDISYPISRAYQFWNFSHTNLRYTPLYIDLIDDHNQATTNNRFIRDNVRGYTLPQIEGFLKNIYGFTSLGTQLKAHKPLGVTDGQIDELLSQYQE